MSLGRGSCTLYLSCSDSTSIPSCVCYDIDKSVKNAICGRHCIPEWLSFVQSVRQITRDASCSTSRTTTLLQGARPSLTTTRCAFIRPEYLPFDSANNINLKHILLLSHMPFKIINPHMPSCEHTVSASLALCLLCFSPRPSIVRKMRCLCGSLACTTRDVFSGAADALSASHC